MSHKPEIKEGAFVVADAHYSPLNPLFLDFLKDIDEKKLNPTQLILLGDIFDTLFGGIEHTYEANIQAIRVLQKISLDIEVFYLEGNHDFNLQKIFTNIKIYPIEAQPLLCSFEERQIYLAHGDVFGSVIYKIYLNIIRNRVVLKLLNIANSFLDNFIFNRLLEYLAKKDNCKKISHLREIILRRLSKKFVCDYFVEGHFHQNSYFDFKDFKYFNLAAFACNQRYFIVKSSQGIEFLQENVFSKGI